MEQKEREKRLAYARGQFEIAKSYVLYWQAMALTGAATLRNTAQGREVTRGGEGQWSGHRVEAALRHGEDAERATDHALLTSGAWTS